MRPHSARLWHSPLVAAVMGLSFVLVPLGFALPGGGEGPAKRPVAQDERLPRCTIDGTHGDDVLVGTPGDDVICGLGGNDVIHGRGGDDTLFGSFGDDVLDGGPGGDMLRGHWGRDRLLGGPGEDLLHGGGNADALSGGRGVDTADYSTRVSRVRVSIGRGANDGVTGEHDNVRSDVENVLGGAAADTLVGSGRANGLDGRGGNDTLTGRGGSDALLGGTGGDRLQGRDAARFRDMLNCGPGGGDVAMANSRDRVMGSCEDSNQPKVANRAPTEISLSRATLPEHQPVGTVVGTLSAVDRDAGDRHRFRLVGGDAAAFRIEGAELRTAAVFDFQTKSAYSIRVRVTDGDGARFEKDLTITVTVVNEAEVNSAPTDVALSPSTVAENQPAGSTVGMLAATDADAGQAHGFALAAGAGDTDNAAFMVSGDRLQTTQLFDFEDKATYSIRLATTDAAGATFAKALTVTIGDVNEAPTALTLSRSGVAENAPAGTTVGTLAALDSDTGQAHSFTLVNGAGDDENASFEIDGSTLTTVDVFDFETKRSYSIRVRATDDGNPGLSIEQTVTITVDDLDEPPGADAKTVTGAVEDDTTAITLSGSDPEGHALTFAIANAPAHGTLGAIGTPACAGTPVVCTATVVYSPDRDFNGTDSFAYRADDGAGTSTPASVSITVDPVNDAPDAADGSRTTAEDTPTALDLAALVSDVETADPDLSYEIVTPPAHGLATTTTYTPGRDFNGTDSLTYKVTDRGDPAKTSRTGTVTIVVTPVNDAPTATDGTLSTDQDTPATVRLWELVSDVETAGALLTYTIVSSPAHGQLTAIGATERYTPDAGFSGTDSFTYRVTDRGDPDDCGGSPPACDAAKSSQTRTVSISVAKTGCFTDDSQSDFAAGTPDQCDLTSTPGSMKLSFGPSVDQSNEKNAPWAAQLGTATWRGQTFTPARTGELTKVDVKIYCACFPATTPGPDLTLSIRATSGGLPTGADLVSATIAGFSSEAGYEYHTATFASPITLTGGRQYALLVRPNADMELGATYAFFNVHEDVYPGGAMLGGSAGGTQWSIEGSRDVNFRIWFGSGYASAGTFVSSVKDAAPAAGTTPTWTTLSFDAITPADTAVKFQVAASNSVNGLSNFVGPDGTRNTFFTTSGADLGRFDGFRYLKYKAFLSTTDGSATPLLQSVKVCFKHTPA
jgi:hypothetical protein